MKKLIGKSDVEDALKKLDKLTQEEARMAIAENLKATHAVDERVRGVANAVTATDNRVAGVDDRVAGVDDRVARVDKRVAGVDDRVANVGDKVDIVNDKVASVDDKVTSVDDKVASVDDTVKGIDARVASVDDRVKAVDEKVAEVIHGAQIIFSQPRVIVKLCCSDGKEANMAIQQAASDLDQIKRSSSPNLIVADSKLYAFF